MRLADHDGTRRAHAPHDLGVLARRLAVGAGAEGGHLAGHVDFVLDGDGHPQERPLAAGAATRIGLVGLQQRALGRHHAKRVESRGQTRDPPEVELDQLARGDLARRDQLRLAGDAGER